MLPLLGSEPRAYDFTVLHATIWANSPNLLEVSAP